MLFKLLEFALENELTSEDCRARLSSQVEFTQVHLVNFPGATVLKDGTVYRSYESALFTAISDFYDLTRLLSSLRAQTDLTPQSLVPLSRALKLVIHDLAWSNTYEREQDSIISLITSGACLSLGLKLNTANPSDVAQIVLAEAIKLDNITPYISHHEHFFYGTDRKLAPLSQDFLDMVYRRPDIFAFFVHDKETYLRVYPDFEFETVAIFPRGKELLPATICKYPIPLVLRLTRVSPDTVYKFLTNINLQQNVRGVEIKNLGINCNSSFWVDVLSILAQKCPGINTINIDSMPVYNDELSTRQAEVELIPASFANLTQFAFAYGKFGVNFFDSVSKHMPNLKSLDLSFSELSLTGSVTNSFPQLEDLRLDGCTIHPALLSLLLPLMQNLKTLTISNDDGSSLQREYLLDVAPIPTSFNFLTKLTLTNQKFSDSLLISFSRYMPNLQHVNLSGSKIVASGIIMDDLADDVAKDVQTFYLSLDGYNAPLADLFYLFYPRYIKLSKVQKVKDLAGSLPMDDVDEIEISQASEHQSVLIRQKADRMGWSFKEDFQTIVMRPQAS
ncbi:MAG: hypothetical protein LBJ89_00665 [Holosporales bacterium]|jgi:Leucine-rich repeat (LRR) protein|nr:hypothetical protein [Holosporales bacterium]